MARIAGEYVDRLRLRRKAAADDMEWVSGHAWTPRS
jgi:hypothetical protein